MKKPTFSKACLDGSVVLITGGAGAIGRVIVESFLNHGAQVAVVDIGAHAEVDVSPGIPARSRYFQCDVTSETDVNKTFDAVTNAFGMPNIVCCHAGIAEAFPYAEYPLAQFRRVIDVNLVGSFLVSREAVRRMNGKVSAEAPGRIIFTSSWVQDVPWPEISAYSASKSATKQLMRTLAREVADKHIRVNAIAPGIVAVGMAKKQWNTEPQYRQRASRAIPLGFLQPPESLGDAFVFLASDAANYLTGSTLLIDGGCSLYPMDTSASDDTSE